MTADQGRMLLALSALLFGAMAVATRAVSSELGAAQIGAVRFAIGAVGVGVACAVRPGLFVATRPMLLALRGLFGGAAVLGYFLAIEKLGAGVGTLLNYTFPVWATVFAAAFLGEGVTARVGLGLVAATAGLTIVVGPSTLGDALSGIGEPGVVLGLTAGLLSSVLAGAATTTVRALRRTDSSLAVFFAFCVFGGLVCGAAAWNDWRPIGPRAALILLLVGVLSFFAQLLFTYALKFVATGSGSLTTQLTVVSSFGFAALFLGEPIGVQAVVGAAVVMGGVLLAQGGPAKGRGAEAGLDALPPGGR